MTNWDEHELPMIPAELLDGLKFWRKRSTVVALWVVTAIVVVVGLFGLAIYGFDIRGGAECGCGYHRRECNPTLPC